MFIYSFICIIINELLKNSIQKIFTFVIYAWIDLFEDVSEIDKQINRNTTNELTQLSQSTAPNK